MIRAADALHFCPIGIALAELTVPEEAKDAALRARLLYSAARTAGIQGDLGLLLHNDKGAPYLEAHPFSVSISHTSHYLVLALAPWKEGLGIDLEEPRRIPRPELVADGMFSSEDAERALQDPALFLRLWTLKEAYGKYKGRGLADAVLCDHFDMKEGTVLDKGGQILAGCSAFDVSDLFRVPGPLPLSLVYPFEGLIDPASPSPSALQYRFAPPIRRFE